MSSLDTVKPLNYSLVHIVNKDTAAPPSNTVLRILDHLSQNPHATQRDVARSTGLSLGMVNAILGRLSKTGFIKIKGLTGRKLSYIVTPRGLAEKTRRSAEYVQHTLQTYEMIRQRLSNLVDDLQAQGHRQFWIVGSGEIARLTEMVFRERSRGVRFTRFDERPQEVPSESLVLDCTANGQEPAGISILANLVGSPIIRTDPLKKPVSLSALNS